MSLTALLLGATGATGKSVLQSCLESEKISQVFEAGRRTSGIHNHKLSPIHVDFEKLVAKDATECEKLRELKADIVLITLGTTRAAAGGQKPFERIDRDYVLAAAEAARNSSVKEQRIAYCSAGQANSNSIFPYMASKGKTEDGIAELGYHETFIFRPGMLDVPGGREKARLVEQIFTPPLRLTGLTIKTTVLGRAMVKAAVEGSSGLKGIAKPEHRWGPGGFIIDHKPAQQLGST